MFNVLSGLCRTAEIFGANEMVVNSLKITEDTNFLSTAVTSHRWVPLKQVTPHIHKALTHGVKDYQYCLILILYICYYVKGFYVTLNKMSRSKISKRLYVQHVLLYYIHP